MERLRTTFLYERNRELMKRDGDVHGIYNHKRATKQREVATYTEQLVATRRSCELKARASL